MDKSQRSQIVPPVETRILRSDAIGQDFQIQVALPIHRGEERRYPMLVVTDGNLLFDVACTMARQLQFAGLIVPLAIVGVGYPGNNPFQGAILRNRDLTPDERPDPYYPPYIDIDGVCGFHEGQLSWHGAGAFLDFLSGQMLTMLVDDYPLLEQGNGYFGHSMGGGFGAYAALARSGLFDNYLLSSPSLSCNGDGHMLKIFRALRGQGASFAPTRMWMTAAELEENDIRYRPMAFVSSLQDFAREVLAARIAGVEIHTRIYPGENHATVWPFSLIHGLQKLYGVESAGSPA